MNPLLSGPERFERMLELFRAFLSYNPSPAEMRLMVEMEDASLTADDIDHALDTVNVDLKGAR